MDSGVAKAERAVAQNVSNNFYLLKIWAYLVNQW